jgi:hypothetical protein
LIFAGLLENQTRTSVLATLLAGSGEQALLTGIGTH